jgi:hypothetical protein
MLDGMEALQMTCRRSRTARRWNKAMV